MSVKLSFGALTIVCLAGAASAQQVLTFDAGGGLTGTLGDAFTSSNGSAFFNDPAGSDSAPNHTLFGANPNLRWDSYFGMDGNGPSAPGYTSAAVSTTPGSFILGGQAAAGYFRAGPPVGFGTSPGSLPGIFVGRFTTASGVGVINNNFQVEYLVGGVVAYALGGPAVGGIELNEYVSTQSLVGGGAVDVHDVWLEIIPAPGAVALAGIAGLAGLRRRR